MAVTLEIKILILKLIHLFSKLTWSSTTFISYRNKNVHKIIIFSLDMAILSLRSDPRMDLPMLIWPLSSLYNWIIVSMMTLLLKWSRRATMDNLCIRRSKRGRHYGEWGKNEHIRKSGWFCYSFRSRRVLKWILIFLNRLLHMSWSWA